jgi:arylsulfatase A
VNTDLISSVDFLPTLCDAAGTSVPAALKIDGRTFYSQLMGKRGEPREWLYSWYVRDGGGTPQWEYAMSHDYKLYRDGKFYDLRADPFEQKPAQSVANLSGQAAAAAKTLQSALDQYKNARPAHLMTASTVRDSDDGDGAPKKKGGKGKKKS